MASNWLLFDRIRALTRQNRIFTSERIFQDQTNLDRLTSGGDFLDFNQQAAILDQTNLQINRLERYKDYEQMDQTGEISLALDLYADEACLVGDTEVLLVNGSTVTLQELAAAGINNEFYVIAYDLEKKAFTPAVAKGARVSGFDVDVIQIAFTDGYKVKCTADHLFLKDDNVYARAGELIAGDKIKTFSIVTADVNGIPFEKPSEEENERIIESISPAGKAEKVYDIEVPNFHNFAIGAGSNFIMVHNSLVDPERKHTLIIRARSIRLKRELESLFYNTLNWDTMCRPTVRYLCKYGDMPFEISLDSDRTSVTALKFMNVYNFTRIETRYGDLIGFFHMDSMWPKPIFLHPWQVMHLRLTNFENFYAPYGKSILDGGRKAFKQLRLMEDAALIYRITRAPERRKFIIPVGQIPPREVPEYMQMIARNFKRQRFYNPTTGTFDERYSPLIQEDDYFLPRRSDGTGPDVDILQGGENVDKIADIEYFKKKMVAPMKIPFARVGIGEGAGEASEKSLSQSHSEFAKAVQYIQREVANGLTKVAIVHLALRGFPVEDLKGFEIALTATSAMEELYRIETWRTRVGVMSDLKDLGWFPKEWIVTHFTDLTPDEIQELKDLEMLANSVDEEEGEGGGEGGLGGGGGGLPGGDLLGGEGETPEAGGLENAEAEAPAVEAEAGAEPAAPAAPGGAGELPPLGEGGFDSRAQKRLITEMRRKETEAKVKEYLEKIHRRRGYIFDDHSRINQRYDYLVEAKELDGLSKSKPVLNQELYHDPNQDTGLLVEWSVPKNIRDEVIKENLNVVMRAKEIDLNSHSNQDISEVDLPS